MKDGPSVPSTTRPFSIGVLGRTPLVFSFQGSDEVSLHCVGFVSLKQQPGTR